MTREHHEGIVNFMCILQPKTYRGRMVLNFITSSVYQCFFWGAIWETLCLQWMHRCIIEYRKCWKWNNDLRYQIQGPLLVSDRSGSAIRISILLKVCIYYLKWFQAVLNQSKDVLVWLHTFLALSWTVIALLSLYEGELLTRRERVHPELVWAIPSQVFGRLRLSTVAGRGGQGKTQARCEWLDLG